jgi:hypothetical protein
MSIPITCVDNFYSDPDKVRDWALGLDYYPAAPQYDFPGERTQLLDALDQEFFDNFCEKLFSIFYDFSSPVNWICHTHFQKIYSRHENYNNPLNSGWVHIDRNNVFAGVIYLNKNTTANSGTSIFSPNEKFSSVEDLDFSYRNKFYHNEEIDLEEYSQKVQEHNEKFDLTLDIKNKYNRLICYDYDTWHKESNFCMKNEEFRLTQVFFVKQLNAHSFVNLRMKNINNL